MRTKSSIATGLTSLLALTLACDKSSQKEIRVGFIQAKTGIYAPFGEGGLFGVQAAIEDINKQGGILVGNSRMPITLVTGDDESDPAKSGAVAEKLISDEKVRFIVSGDEPPVMHNGVSRVADQHRVPYITSVGLYEPWVMQKLDSPTKWQYTWATGSAVSTTAERGDFRTSPGYTFMDTFAKMLDICGTKTNRKLGLLASSDPDGKESYSSMGAALQNLGYTVVGFDRQLGLLPMETSDFSPVIQTWKEAGVEIIMGNCPGPFFAKAWQQAQAQGLKPKMATIGRAALFYPDVAALGGELPLGVGTEVWWDPSMKNAPGIDGTTPLSLAERWARAKSKPVSPAIGPGYASVQVLADAIQRAGSLDPEKVNAALATTDLPTIRHRVKFDEDHFSRGPIAFGQWMKTDKPQKWELKVVFSNHEFWPANGSPVFPLK